MNNNSFLKISQPQSLHSEKLARSVWSAQVLFIRIKLILYCVDNTPPRSEILSLIRMKSSFAFAALPVPKLGLK
jgi:hypothetical protein